MKYKNKWNGRLYDLVSSDTDNVTLRREDGSKFTISQKEFKYIYHEVTNE